MIAQKERVLDFMNYKGKKTDSKKRKTIRKPATGCETKT